MATDHTKDRLLVGNCLTTLKTLADNSIDSIVTDPPYEIGFMGKGWDSTGIAYNVELWKQCLRVLKPGGHLLSFGATRSYHRMAVAIEDAGFEIRDSIHWTYGSGFPKSLNVSKAIDKAAGAPVKIGKGFNFAGEYNNRQLPNPDKSKATNHTGITKAAKQWNGWGTALKPSHEPIVVARKPLDGTVADNVQQHGTGAINIDATRVGTETITINGQGNDNLFHGNFSGKIDNPTRTGRFPANTLLTHNHDCQQTGTATDQPVAGKRTATFGTQDTQSGGDGSGGWESKPITVATWSCTPSCPIELLDQQQEEVSRFFHNSQWSLADDLAPFIYQAKPGKKERNAGLEALPEKTNKFGNQRNGEDLGNGSVNDKFTTEPSKNFHPTVKPVELMRYLIKMVTPPNGVVLDPFLGSGTTAVAATLEGYAWKGCELTEEYLPIIKGRITWAVAEKKKQDKKAKQLTLEEQE